MLTIADTALEARMLTIAAALFFARPTASEVAVKAEGAEGEDGQNGDRAQRRPLLSVSEHGSAAEHLAWLLARRCAALEMHALRWQLLGSVGWAVLS